MVNRVIAYGFGGFSTFDWDSFQGFGTTKFEPFTGIGPNLTCPSASSLGANSVIITVQTGTSFAFALADAAKLVASFSGRGGVFSSVTNFNNFPVDISGSTGTLRLFVRSLSIPQTVAPLLPFVFQVSKSPIDVPATINTLNLGAEPYTMTFPTLADCASQEKMNFRQGAGDSGINADGTVKGTQGAFCLSQQTRTGISAIPGLLITTILLLLILLLLMFIPTVRKIRFFNIVFIAINVICLSFLVAAVASGAAYLAGKAGPCKFLADFTNEQFMPSPNSVALNGFIPSSGGYPLVFNGARGQFNAVQNGNTAAYYKPIFVPGPGAALIIVAILLLFVFVIVFAIKTDWASGGNSSSDSAAMTPM